MSVTLRYDLAQLTTEVDLLLPRVSERRLFTRISHDRAAFTHVYERKQWQIVHRESKEPPRAAQALAPRAESLRVSKSTSVEPGCIVA